MTNKIYILSALAGAILAAAFVGGEADAYYSTTAYDCHATGGSMVDTNFGVGNASTTQDMVLRCNTPGRVAHKRGVVIGAAVHGRDGTTTGRLASQLCLSYGEVAGGTCGPSVYSATGDVKNEELELSTSVWDGGDLEDFAYVAVRVPPRQSSSMSSVFGIRYW